MLQEWHRPAMRQLMMEWQTMLKRVAQARKEANDGGVADLSSSMVRPGSGVTQDPVAITVLLADKVIVSPPS